MCICNADGIVSPSLKASLSPLLNCLSHLKGMVGKCDMSVCQPAEGSKPPLVGRQCDPLVIACDLRVGTKEHRE